MKNIWIILVLISLGNAVCAQRTEPGKPFTKEEYLHKSRNQKTAAWTMLGGGALMAFAGAVWFGNSFEIFSSDNDNEETMAVVVGAVGVAAMAGSIPLFIASARNKNKALNVTAAFDWKHISSPGKGMIRQVPYPAISLKFCIK